MSWLRRDQEENRRVHQADSPESDLVSPSDIVFENSDLKLIVQKGIHKRQKNFRLQDHMFYFKIEVKDKSSSRPLLIDILDFLHAAFVHVLESIATFYEKGTNVFNIPSQ